MARLPKGRRLNNPAVWSRAKYRMTEQTPSRAKRILQIVGATATRRIVTAIIVAGASVLTASVVDPVLVDNILHIAIQIALVAF